MQITGQGPVAVTGASGHIGGCLLRRLEGLPNEVRPLGRNDDHRSALRGASAVVHVAGTLEPVRGNTDEDANVRTARTLAEALDGSSVGRCVFLSFTGAHPAASNAYLRTKGRAERILLDAFPRAVIFRSTFVFGPPEDPGPSAAPLIASAGKALWVTGSGRRRYAPVYVLDVVEALVAAAPAADAPAGTFALAGPDVLSVDEFVGSSTPAPFGGGICVPSSPAPSLTSCRP